MRYQTVLFDLDGTLADNYEGITRGVQQALAYFGIEVADRQELSCFIGPPILDSFMQFYHLSETNALQAVERYRTYYRAKGIYEVALYPGVTEMVKTLHNAGVILCTASSKPKVFVQKILEGSGLLPYFSHAVGADLSGGLQTKESVCLEALRLSNTLPEHAVLVGDRMYDAEGAAICKLDFIGVLYGFGSREEFAPYPSVLLAEDCETVTRFLLEHE